VAAAVNLIKSGLAVNCGQKLVRVKNYGLIGMYVFLLPLYVNILSINMYQIYTYLSENFSEKMKFHIIGTWTAYPWTEKDWRTPVEAEVEAVPEAVAAGRESSARKRP
jgi:hypothetical protein